MQCYLLLLQIDTLDSKYRWKCNETDTFAFYRRMQSTEFDYYEKCKSERTSIREVDAERRFSAATKWKFFYAKQKMSEITWMTPSRCGSFNV